MVVALIRVIYFLLPLVDTSMGITKLSLQINQIIDHERDSVQLQVHIAREHPSIENVCLSKIAPTASGGKIMFAGWIWAIYLLFPAIFALQPAVTTQVII